MFNRKLRIDIKCHGEILASHQNQIYKKVSTDEIVECDRCGCLLKKDSRFKLKSTVGYRQPPEPQGFSGWPGHAWQPTEPVEYIVEHYKCLRCKNTADETEE